MLAGIDREQDGDEAAHDMRVAVALEIQHRAGRAVRPDIGDEPHLAGAALHFIGVVMRRVGERRQFAPQLDHVAIAVVPLVEQREILDDVVNRGHAPDI